MRAKSLQLCLTFCAPVDYSPPGSSVYRILQARILEWLNAVLGCNLKNDRMISVRFQGKPFNIMVIQAYTPTSNAEDLKLKGSMKTYKTF